MKKGRRVSVGGLLILLALTQTAQGSVSADVLPTNDNFDQKTISKIIACLEKFRVPQTPRVYQVYMLTGGLNTPNPDILYWDDDGNMTFAPVPRHLPLYEFQQTSICPATWMMKGGLVAQGRTTQARFQPIPWERKLTRTGETYYSWVRNSYMTEHYFKKGHTFIVLQVSAGTNNTHYPFPEGVLSHLKPLGNPIKH